MPRPRQLAYVSVAALLLIAAAGGVGYAAASTSTNVSACVNGKGRLALQNAKGRCPAKFKRVTIAKQGPRGVAGPRGATGARGAQGPGATALAQDFTAAGTGTPRVVGGLVYTPSCSLDNANGAVAVVSVKASAGANVSVHGLRTIEGNARSITAGPSAMITVVFANGTSGTTTEVAPGALVFSGKTTQTVSMSATVIGVGAPDGVRCRLRGTITPAA